MSDRIERAKAATTKDELEAIAKEVDGKIVKQRGLETIRADVLVLLDEAEQPPKEEQNEQEPKAPEPAPAKRKGVTPDPRRLKNTKNGRVFPYSAALAKKSGVVEVKGKE